MTRQLRGLSAHGWQEMLKILGTGDFTRIEFRPPRDGQEQVIADIARRRADGKGTWWICEADYLDCVTMPDGAVLGCDEITRRFAFRLTEPLPAEDN